MNIDTKRGSCDIGWSSFDGHCYLVVRVEKPWDDALAYCQNRDSYLLEITTDEELEFVDVELIRDYRKSFWVGATNREHFWEFVYQHSKERVPEMYWRPGQPDNYRDGLQCVYMWRRLGEAQYRNFKLNDLPCDYEFYFVCEK